MSEKHLFFLNDCIPSTIEKYLFVDMLSNSLIEFNKLIEMDIDVSRGIVTHKQPLLCKYNDDQYNLQDLIDLIEDKTLRRLAYSFFLRFPIGEPYYDDSSEELLTEKYLVTVEEEEFNALNLAIVQKSDGFLLSPAISENLKVHPINIRNETGLVLNVPNLFGEELNTEIIRDFIIERNKIDLNLFEKFLTVFDKPIHSKQFKKDFESLSINSKQLVINHFDQAIKRNLPSKFSADGNLIKDVTPTKKKCDVFELRVRKNKELRVYFNESNGNVFFASIGFKNNNQQDQDIKSAHSAIYKLIVTN